MDKVKVSQVAAFMNVGGASESLKRMAKGITDLTISYSPTETSETYIDEDNATTSVDGYKVSIDQEQTAYAGEEIFEYIDGLRQSHATGSDCETSIVIVNIYDETTTSGTYTAEKYNAVISVSEFGGKGGESAKIKYKVNLNGNPVQGTATIVAGAVTFTAA